MVEQRCVASDAGVEETKETNDVADEQLKAAAISVFFFKGNRIFNSDLTVLCFIVPFVTQLLRT